VKYPQPMRRAGAVAGDLTAALRRRRERGRPRVRVRVAHGHTEVLAEGTPAQERLLGLARELVDEYGGRWRAGR
jgi:hypothetical protein